ncbi:50S ribosomal protein L31 [Candidatus Saccharibacteria bacterium]|nr:50S ribosomal protein L31 [Candidatus Saccharibacteria bacterium]
MKTGIHPELKDTKVTCLGCGTTFNTRSTTNEITVEVCSNCHPFYTGKQKLVDTAGRVDKFRARMEAAKTSKGKAKTKKDRNKDQRVDVAAELKAVKQELAQKTTDKKDQPAEK